MAKNKDQAKASAAAEEAKRVAAVQAAERDRERRGFIETMAGLRIPPETIGMLLVPPIGADEIKASYARELEAGPAKVDAKIANGILAYLEKNDRTTLIYLSKVFLGWSEKGSEQKKDPVEEPEAAPPTKLPSAQTVMDKILPFKQKN